VKLLVNVHFKGAHPWSEDDEATPEDVAESLLRTFQNMDNRQWFLTSVAIQPSPKPLLHARDL
jgi:GAF domain-containing protein